MGVVYGDELFLENLLIDYILLVVTARVTGTAVKRTRAAAGAAVGGAYSLAVLLSEADILVGIVTKVAVGAIMVLTAFGGGRRYLRLCLVFIAVSAAFAGVVMAVTMIVGNGSFWDISFSLLAAAFAVFYGLFSLVFGEIGRHHVAGEITHLVIGCRGRRVKVTALVDTGNALYDPLTGRPVTICTLEAVSGLFDRETMAVLRSVPDPAQAISALAGKNGCVPFSLVPYRALGVERGMLLAFKPETMERDGKKVKGGMVAISREDISEGNGYSALTNAG